MSPLFSFLDMQLILFNDDLQFFALWCEISVCDVSAWFCVCIVKILASTTSFPNFLVTIPNSTSVTFFYFLQGDGMTSIEPTAGTINDVCVFPESGLLLLALDCSQIPSYFIPALGTAPKWCSYLEHLTVRTSEIILNSVWKSLFLCVHLEFI